MRGGAGVSPENFESKTYNQLFRLWYGLVRSAPSRDGAYFHAGGNRETKAAWRDCENTPYSRPPGLPCIADIVPCWSQGIESRTIPGVHQRDTAPQVHLILIPHPQQRGVAGWNGEAGVIGYLLT